MSIDRRTSIPREKKLSRSFAAASSTWTRAKQDVALCTKRADERDVDSRTKVQRDEREITSSARAWDPSMCWLDAA